MTDRATDDTTQIRKVLGDRTRALHDKDSSLAVAHLAEDAVMFTLAPPLQFAGAKARDRADLETWFATWRGPIGWELRDPDIAVGGDIAFARGLGHMTGTKVDGEAIDLWTRSTICFRRLGGAWKIVHEHESVPFYMDGSYRAAIDLKA
jgi:PhnB protein